MKLYFCNYYNLKLILKKSRLKMLLSQRGNQKKIYGKILIRNTNQIIEWFFSLLFLRYFLYAKVIPIVFLVNNFLMAKCFIDGGVKLFYIYLLLCQFLSQSTHLLNKLHTIYDLCRQFRVLQLLYCTEIVYGKVIQVDICVFKENIIDVDDGFDGIIFQETGID